MHEPSGRLPFVQGLRAVAVLLVVVFHSGLPVPGGFVGVDVFFVISGFVITRLLLREATGDPGRLRRFYARRIRRILPALAVTTSAVLVAAAFLQSPIDAQENTAKIGAAASVSLANFALFKWTGGYFDVAPSSVPLLHTWSLAVEEQFYLFMPIMLLGAGWLFARRHRSRNAAAGVVMAGVAVVSFAACLAVTFRPATFLGRPENLAFYMAPTRAWEFAIGGFLAAIEPRFIRLPKVAGDGLAAVGLLGLGAAALLIRTGSGFPGYVAALPALGTALVLIGGLAGSRANGVLSRAPLLWVGDRSYSLYLWHWPLIVFALSLFPGSTAAQVLAAALSFPLAALSYAHVEQRFRVPRPVRLDALRVAATCVLVPMLLAVGLLVGARTFWNRSEIRDLADQVLPVPLYGRVGCADGRPLSDERADRCSVTEGSERVFLLGDSNAGQFGEGLQAASMETGAALVLGTMSSCPFVDLVVREQGVDWGPCRRYVTDSTEWLRQQPPAHIVLAASDALLYGTDFAFEDPVSHRVSESLDAKKQTWQAGIERTIRSLQAAGHKITLMRTLPHFYSHIPEPWSPRTCRLWTLLRDITDCSAHRSRTEADAQQATVLAAERAAARATGVELLDLRSVVCPRGQCVTNRGNRWTYRDGFHLTNDASTQLAPFFTALFRQ